MKSFGNLTGTFMKKDSPQIEFRFRRGELVEFSVINKPDSYEFRYAPEEKAFLLMMSDRLVPDTRIGIQKDLEKVGIPYYDPQLILEYTHGFSITDDYWIKLSGEDITWDELLKQKKFAGH